MRLQKLQEREEDAPPAPQSVGGSKKRKASDDEDGGANGTLRKRNKPTNGLPEGFFDPGNDESKTPFQPTIEMQIPSRPATPSKPSEAIPQKPEPSVDEDEWAAFEADIATAEAQVTAANEAVISAPAMSAADLAKKSAEDDYLAKKERQEAELEGDKEDAARKLEEEFEEMESLEARVKRLREKREELRTKESLVGLNKPAAPTIAADPMDDEEEEEDSDDDDEWQGFRMKG